MRYCEFLHENYAFFFSYQLTIFTHCFVGEFCLDTRSFINIENLDKAQNGNHEDGDWFYFRAERAK
jgi:hypothetical protein